MAAQSIDPELLHQALEINAKIEQGVYENVTVAAKETGISRSTLVNRISLAHSYKERGELEEDSAPSPILPDFGDKDVPIEEVIDLLQRRFQKRQEHEAAKKWFEIKFPKDEVVGLCVMGDPHLGPQCDFQTLRSHIDIFQNKKKKYKFSKDGRFTDGLYCLNLGDTVDNWPWGRLAALYAEEDISRPTERKLGKWLLESCPFIVWMHGNHDMFHGEFTTYLESINCTKIPMMDWQAKFKLVFPSGEIRIDAKHDQKGHSQYNPVHGLKKTILWGQEQPDLILAGHKHISSLAQEELENGKCVTMARARGYKHLDSYALRYQYAESSAWGSSWLFVIDVTAEGPMKIVPFGDIEEGADYLAWKRSR